MGLNHKTVKKTIRNLKIVWKTTKVCLVIPPRKDSQYKWLL